MLFIWQQTIYYTLNECCCQQTQMSDRLQYCWITVLSVHRASTITQMVMDTLHTSYMFSSSIMITLLLYVSYSFQHWGAAQDGSGGGGGGPGGGGGGEGGGAVGVGVGSGWAGGGEVVLCGLLRLYWFCSRTAYSCVTYYKMCVTSNNEYCYKAN